MRTHAQAGFSLIEVMIASAVFVVFASGIVYTLLQASQGNRYSSERTIAKEYATEGIEAVRSIQNQSFSLLSNTSGTGVSQNTSHVWAFSGTNTTFDIYTRAIALADVYRDGTGTIVATGGTQDPNTKKVTSTVTWAQTPTKTGTIALSTYVTNWRTSVLTQSDYLSIGTASATRDHKLLDLIGITLQNTGPAPITITKITPTWTMNGNKINQIQIAGTVVWDSSGVGSPLGKQSSGVALTILPYAIASNSGELPLDDFLMQSNIQHNEQWTITFTMADTSQRTVTVISP